MSHEIVHSGHSLRGWSFESSGKYIPQSKSTKCSPSEGNQKFKGQKVDPGFESGLGIQFNHPFYLSKMRKETSFVLLFKDFMQRTSSFGLLSQDDFCDECFKIVVKKLH